MDREKAAELAFKKADDAIQRNKEKLRPRNQEFKEKLAMSMEAHAKRKKEQYERMMNGG